MVLFIHILGAATAILGGGLLPPPPFETGNEMPEMNVWSAFQFLYHNSNSASYDVIANCIKKFYIECLGYQQADNGYWNSETLTETHVPNNRRTTIRVPNECKARPKRVLRISDNYSVASRAPDPRQYLATLTQQNLPPQLQEAQQENPQTLPRLP
jgi:hypothetical protein